MYLQDKMDLVLFATWKIPFYIFLWVENISFRSQQKFLISMKWLVLLFCILVLIPELLAACSYYQNYFFDMNKIIVLIIFCKPVFCKFGFFFIFFVRYSFFLYFWNLWQQLCRKLQIENKNKISTLTKF